MRYWILREILYILNMKRSKGVVAFGLGKGDG
jgi:hypothetical protein